MPAIRLCLARGSNTGTALTIGLPCPAQGVTGEFAGVLPGIIGDVQVRGILAATVAASFPPLRGYANLDFNINLLPDTVHTTAFCFCSTGSINRVVRVAENDGSATQAKTVPSWQSALTVTGRADVTFQTSPRLATQQTAAWNHAALTTNTRRVWWAALSRLSNTQAPKWRPAPVLSGGTRICAVSHYTLANLMATTWQGARLLPRPLFVCAGDGFGVRPVWIACWQPAGLPERWKRPVFSPPSPDIAIPTRRVRLCLGRRIGNRLTLGLRCAFDGRPYYMIEHDLHVRRLPNGPDIEVGNVNLKFDADSWAWSWDATILGAASLEAVKPELDGTPATLEIRIDEFYWRVLVEDWSQQRQFSKRDIKASGRGLTALLSDPYYVPSDGMLTEDRRFAQLLDERLPDDDSWELVYPTHVPDWVVPAGAYSWQKKTPMQVMHDAAQAMGMMLVPDRVAKRITAMPRYPILPWHFAEHDPMRVITDAGVLSCDSEPSGVVRANAVFVHGGNTGGIMARVLLDGSAGDHVASTVECALVTDPAAAQLLGSRVLASQYTQPTITQVAMPLGGVDFPLVSVGEYVELLGSRGIVSAVSVSATLQSVRQVVTIGEGTGNLFSQWLDLIPQAPLLVCRVITRYNNNTVTVSPLAGGFMRVRGDAAVDSWVYVRDGVIESEAPALTGLEIGV